VFVPDFSVFMALIGAFCCQLLAFVLPAAFHLAACQRGARRQRRLRVAAAALAAEAAGGAGAAMAVGGSASTSVPIAASSEQKEKQQKELEMQQLKVAAAGSSGSGGGGGGGGGGDSDEMSSFIAAVSRDGDGGGVDDLRWFGAVHLLDIFIIIAGTLGAVAGTADAVQKMAQGGFKGGH
jgi:hypothetical protein